MVVNVTFCAVVYVPAAGDATGVSALGRFMVYAAVIISLLFQPSLTAMAFRVVVALILIAPAYSVLEIVGFVPLVV